MGCKFAESLGVVALILLQKSHDSLEFFVFKLLVNVFEVLPSISPVKDFFQRSRVFILMMGIRVRDDFLDLTVPLNDDGLKSFNEVFVLTIAKRKVFFWNVKLSVSFFLVASFSDGNHEFVELGKELFFNVIRPRSFVYDTGDENGVHESKQTFESVLLDQSDQHFHIQVSHGDHISRKVVNHCHVNLQVGVRFF